jgi:putative ABC transport system permease protein
MPLFHRLASLWRNLTDRAGVERDLDDEVRAAYEMMVDEKMQAGLGADEARRAARIELGGIDNVKDRIRDVKAGAFVDVLLQDARYAARLLRRNPLFAVTATLSLAIGIGANATIFSVANALLFRAPIGVADPDRVVDIGISRNNSNGFNPGSYPDYLDIRQRATTLDGVYATVLFGERISLRTSGGAMTPVFASQVTANFFTVLRAQAAIGRLFDERDADAEMTPVVLSHRFWQRQFNLDAAVVGQTLQLDGRPFAVAGVAAEGFQGTRIVAPDVWLPIAAVAGNSPDATARLTSRAGGWLAMGARLKEGASLPQTAAELDAIGRVLQREHPEENRGKNFRVKTSSHLPGGDVPVSIFLALMMAVVTLVLAVAGANVGSVLLARAASRRQEIAVRLAMGAPRWRLVRQLLTETLLLFAAGGAGGLLLALMATRLLLRLMPAVPFPLDLPVPLDGRVVVFTSALSLAAALVSGLAPALQSSKADVTWTLNDGAHGSAGRSRLRSAFVVAQVAISMVLVISAGLFVRALERAGSLHPGFNPHGVELATVDFGIAGYTDANGPGFGRAVLERVAALPGIEAATLAKVVPGGFESIRFGLTIPGAGTANGLGSFDTDWNIVEPGYFRTLGIPIVSGRDFNPADRAGRPGVVILSEAAARRFWPGEPAVGKFVVQHGLPPGAERTLLVVGVVRDIRTSSLVDGFANPFVYVPLQQQYASRLTSAMTIVARTAQGRRRAAADIRAALAELNPDLPVITSQTLEDSMALGLMPQRFAASLSSVLGAIGLLLAAIGIYGVAAYAVARRTREIGIRVALGARPAGVVGMVLGQGMSLAAIGAAIGLVLAAGVSRVLSGFLFGVPPMDPAIFGAAAGLAAVVGLIACYVPARRAVRINAMEALRYE